MSKRIYISGAITGTDDYMDRFAEAEAELTRAGYSVINPAKVNAQLPAETTYNEYMLMSFCMLDMCDCIYMLRGWEDSKGSSAELRRAQGLGIEIYYQPLSDWRERLLNVFMSR